MHNIARKYTGKDDHIAIIRNQGIFPAPEKIVEPYATITCAYQYFCLRAVLHVGMRFLSKFRVGITHVILPSAVDVLRKSDDKDFGIAMAQQAEIAYTGLWIRGKN